MCIRDRSPYRGRKTTETKEIYGQKSQYLPSEPTSGLNCIYSIYLLTLLLPSHYVLLLSALETYGASKLHPRHRYGPVTPSPPAPCFLAVSLKRDTLRIVATCVANETIFWSRRSFTTPFLAMDPPSPPPTTLAASGSLKLLQTPKTFHRWRGMFGRVSVCRRTHFADERIVLTIARLEGKGSWSIVISAASPQVYLCACGFAWVTSGMMDVSLFSRFGASRRPPLLMTMSIRRFLSVVKGSPLSTWNSYFASQPWDPEVYLQIVFTMILCCSWLRNSVYSMRSVY